MARKKVKLAWIPNDSSRRATFKKRKKGMMKKVSELSILCDVKACAIVYGPYDTQPEVWPNPVEAMRVLERFRSMPEMEQSKKMMNQEGFLRARIKKVEEQRLKMEKENNEADLTTVMYRCLAGCHFHDLDYDKVRGLLSIVDAKLRAVRDRIEGLEEQIEAVGVDGGNPNLPYAPAPQPPAMAAGADQGQEMAGLGMGMGMGEELGPYDALLEMLMRRQGTFMSNPQFFRPGEEVGATHAMLAPPPAPLFGEGGDSAGQLELPFLDNIHALNNGGNNSSSSNNNNNNANQFWLDHYFHN